MEAQEKNKVGCVQYEGPQDLKCLVNIRDLDEIDADLGVDKVDKLLTQNIDYDKTGLGQFYCVHCA